jgi:hypothetical protein
MAPDDRDRTFEKALARHLRYIAPTSADSDASVSMPCPEPEILAAYHDGSLGAEELALWKQHVVSCENCQAVLAHLAEPLEVPTDQQAAEKVVVAQAASAARPEPQAAAPVTEIRPRRMYLRWLAPAGAIAAVLLVMLVVERSRPVFKSPSERIETASSREPAPVAPPPAASSSAESDAVRARQELSKAAAIQKEKESTLSAGRPAGGLASRVAEPKRQSEPARGAANEFAHYSAHGPAVSQQQQQRQIASGPGEDHGIGPAPDKKKDEAQAVPMVSENGRDLSAKARLAPSPPSSVAENQPSFIADDSRNRRATDKVAPALAPAASAKARPGVSGGAESGAMEQTVNVESSSTALMTLRADAFTTAPTFGTPAGSVLWRVGAAGSIEHSIDSGSTWTPQASGVTANLTTGYALTARVCWVVGASGMILRTTDGGAHWIKISSPVAADLIGIRSTDAFHATVWFVDEPKTGAIKSFKTSDGGVNWSPAPIQ